MTTSFLQYLQEQLSKFLGKETKVMNVQLTHGGDINTAFVMATGEGNFFVKQNKASLADMFMKEYNGLQYLKEHSLLKIPQPLLYGAFENDAYLVMEFVQKQTFTKAAWKALGEGLALQHRQTSQGFGFYENNYIGSLPQTNDVCESWSEFYFIKRIMPLLEKALAKNLCTINDMKHAERFRSRLPSLFTDEPPALLHGDLWYGNVMACTHNKAAIYDPAVYYGNREMDIAMSFLFGGFDETFYQSYNEIYPLQKGWQQRLQLCQLYPLLVHLVLFGKGYYSRVKDVLNEYK